MDELPDTFWGTVNHVIAWVGCLTFFVLWVTHC